MPRRLIKFTGPHPVDVAVGKRVRLRRLQLAMSQTELAEQLGLTFQQVQKYEKGTNRISCSTLSETAEALDCPIAFFFSDENEPDTELNLADNPTQAPTDDDRRLIKAAGQMEKSKRKKVLALVESMVRVKR